MFGDDVKGFAVPNMLELRGVDTSIRIRGQRTAFEAVVAEISHSNAGCHRASLHTMCYDAT